MAVKLTQQELEELRSLKTTLDDDNIRFKEIIKKRLLSNRKLIRVIDNKELSDADEAEEFDQHFGVDILPYYLIHPTQTNAKNYICYEIQFNEESRYNQAIKVQQIIFYCLSEQKGIINHDTYLATHDLMASLIKQQFNWTNFMGMQMHLVSDKPSVTDNDYATRTLIFELESPNNMVKTINRKPTVVNGGRLEI